MNLEPKEYDYDTLKNQGTGESGEPTDHKIIVYPFEKYEIKIMLTASNEFIGIVEVKINKDFLSQRERASAKGFHDVEKFYPE